MSKLIKQEPTTTAIAVPDFLKDVKSSSGLDDIEVSSLTIPRLNLMQSSSKEVKKKLAVAGRFQNSITKEDLGPQVELVIIKANAGAVNINMDDGLKCKSSDGKVNDMNGGKCSECWLGCYYNDWKSGAPACSATFDLIVVERSSLLSSAPNVMAMTMRKTSYKLGKDLLSRAKFLNKPLFSQSYSFGCEYKDHPKGGYEDLTVKYNGWVSAEEFKAAEECFKGFASKKYIVDDEFNKVDDSASTVVEDDSVGF